MDWIRLSLVEGYVAAEQARIYVALNNRQVPILYSCPPNELSNENAICIWINVQQPSNNVTASDEMIYRCVDLKIEIHFCISLR